MNRMRHYTFHLKAVAPHRCLTVFTLGILLLMGGTMGCHRDGAHIMDEEVLIRVGGSVVTVREFHETFESGLISPSTLFQDPEALREERYRVLNRLAEELVIIERGRELNIQVSDEEVDQFLEQIKTDYPDDTFEQTLMEYGVSLVSWKKATRQRLLLEKVINRDLAEGAFKTPLPLDKIHSEDNRPDQPAEDMEKEPIRTPDHASPEKAEPPAPQQVDESSGHKDVPDARQVQESLEDGKAHDLSRLHESPENEDATASRQAMNTVPGPAAPFTGTAETRYPGWINRLKQQYIIEIDWKLWEKIVQETINGTSTAD